MLRNWEGDMEVWLFNMLFSLSLLKIRFAHRGNKIEYLWIDLYSIFIYFYFDSVQLKYILDSRMINLDNFV